MDVTSFDPYVKNSEFEKLEDALQNTDCLVLVTNHDEFKQLTPTMMKKYDVKALIDTRNMFDKNEFEKAGIVYKGIGC